VKSLTLGILAHVDAGKTSLTERLLHHTGAIDEIGSVDEGSTQTDSMALERQRGITIKSAVVSFAIDDVVVNLIDTPGHPDFIAEVERVLGVLDGAVLVISAVEGVQPQTRILMRTLKRLRIPTLIFVNKIDRVGAQRERLLASVAEKLTPAIVPMGLIDGLGAGFATFRGYGPRDASFVSQLTEVLTEHDDTLLAEYVNGAVGIPYPRLLEALAAQTRNALVCPVFFGSAMTGAGVGELIAGVRELLSARIADLTGPPSGVVFKVERGAAGEKIAYVRLFAGSVSVRDRLRFGHGREAKVTAMTVFQPTGARRAAVAIGGQVVKIWGLDDIRIGDPIGAPAARIDQQFPPPTLETVVAACRPADRGALHAALAQLAEQDPLINLRRDELRQEVAVSLYGEVQKEVIQATLADVYGVEVTFRDTTTICVERPVSAGEAHEVIAKGANPFLATVGLRVEPGPVGSGVEVRLGVELGSMPLAFFNAVEETVQSTLQQGLYGWQVIDCLVTITHSGYWARQSHAGGGFDKSMSSTAGDFRNLTPLVLMDALRRANTRVCEPICRFRLDLPGETLPAVLPVLSRCGAVPRSSALHGSAYVIDGDIPAARTHDLERQLPSLTSGEGVLEIAFDHYREARGERPTRARTDHNPLRREEYLLHVQRRV
jgi:ribosomal protection tetracycline resistance protein